MCDEQTEKKFGIPISGQEILNGTGDDFHPGVDIIAAAELKGTCWKIKTLARPSATSCWDYINRMKPKLKDGCQRDVRKTWMHRASECERAWPPRVWIKS